MKVINVLGDNQDLPLMLCLEFRQSEVSTVWLRIPAVRSAHIIEFMDEAWIVGETFRRRNLLQIEL
jgi:hypothetical protein